MNELTCYSCLDQLDNFLEAPHFFPVGTPTPRDVDEDELVFGGTEPHVSSRMSMLAAAIPIRLVRVINDVVFQVVEVLKFKVFVLFGEDAAGLNGGAADIELLGAEPQNPLQGTLTGDDPQICLLERAGVQQVNVIQKIHKSLAAFLIDNVKFIVLVAEIQERR